MFTLVYSLLYDVAADRVAVIQAPERVSRGSTVLIAALRAGVYEVE